MFRTGWKMWMAAAALGIGAWIVFSVWPMKFGLSGENGDYMKALLRNAGPPMVSRILGYTNPIPEPQPDYGFIYVFWHLSNLDDLIKPVKGSDEAISFSREQFDDIWSKLDVDPQTYYFKISRIKSDFQKFVSSDPNFGMGSWRESNYDYLTWSDATRQFKVDSMMLYKELQMPVEGRDDPSKPAIEFSAVYAQDVKFNIPAPDMPPMMNVNHELRRCQHDFVRGSFPADREGYYALRMHSQALTRSTHSIKIPPLVPFVNDVLVILEIHPKAQ